MYWQTSRFQIDLSQPKVMGIVNVTPDSFSDGGLHATTADALRHCESLIAQGADLLDIGGESTRPGAQPLAAADELARVLPVVRGAVRLGVPISVDTYKPEVMQAVLDLGADVVNDIWALRWTDPSNGLSAAEVVARHPCCGICVMHMHGEPKTMQVSPMGGEILPQVLSFLEQVTQKLIALEVEKTRILLDPGPGFGKTVAQNFSLLARQRELLGLGFPLLAAWSRKSSLAGMATPPADLMPGAHERMLPSVAAALIAVERGARVVRVHDVAPTVQALKVWAEASCI